MIEKLRNIISVILILMCNIAFSFKEKEKIIFCESEYLIFNNPSIAFVNAIQTENYLNNFLNKKFEGQKLKLIKSNTSPAGRHLLFKHLLNGTEIYQSIIQANYNNDGILYSVINSIAKFNNIVTGEISNNYKIWINTTSGLQIAYFKIENNRNERVKNIYSSGGKILYSHNLRRYKAKPDSLVTAMVYLPNPIVAANTSYGGDFKDNGDANNLSLQNARSKVRVPLKYENGKFYLTNGLITLKNLHDPSYLPITPIDTFLNYTRNQSEFEDINVFYHINTMTEYLKIRGFDAMLDSIYVDSHGANGDDNSFCDPSLYPIEIEFGTGNIDDGEDGQVIIHEFGHALSAVASPTDVIGAQRNAMEEGQADYFCMSYTSYFSNNKKGMVFSWDGHNEFWDGFWSNTTKQYKDLTGIKDDDREVWSTALMCVFDKIGRNISDSLILTQLFQQSSNSSMPQMARVILKNDSLIFGGKHVAAIWQCFTDRGILDTVPWKLINTQKVDLKNLVKIYNSSGFAYNLAVLKIELSKHYLFDKIEVYDFAGKKLKSYNPKDDVYLSPQDYKSGIYFINVTSEKKGISINYKIVKY